MGVSYRDKVKDWPLKKKRQPIRRAKIQNPANPKCWQKYGATGTLIHWWWECKMVHPLWRTVWQFLTKLNILLPHAPEIVLLGICPKDLQTYIHMKTCTRMFIAALLITAKTQKQPKCPSVSERINWYIQTMEYRNTSETSWVWFQTTTIKWILQ